jgi:hypothetical protein
MIHHVKVQTESILPSQTFLDGSLISGKGGEPLRDSQHQCSYLEFSNPYPPKLLITPTSPSSAISPLMTKPRMSPVETSRARS